MDRSEVRIFSRVKIKGSRDKKGSLICTNDFLSEAIMEMPLSKRNPEQFKALRTWAKYSVRFANHRVVEPQKTNNSNQIQMV